MQRPRTFGTVRRCHYLRPHHCHADGACVAVISTVFNIFSQLLGDNHHSVPRCNGEGQSLGPRRLRRAEDHNTRCGPYIAEHSLFTQQYIMTVTQRIVYDLREDINLKRQIASAVLRRTSHDGLVDHKRRDMVSQTFNKATRRSHPRSPSPGGHRDAAHQPSDDIGYDIMLP